MKFKIDEGYLAYEQNGNGIPILFVHGYPLSRRIWEAQLAGLSDIAYMVSIDLRGHGESYSFDPPYTMDMLAEDCKQLLEGERINTPTVVCGLSMGGYVTLALYRKYPDLFRGMILTSTWPGTDSPESKANRDEAVINVRENGVSFIADGMLPKTVSPLTSASNPELLNHIRSIMLETSVQGVVGASQGMRDRSDSTPWLSQIKVPVLIVHGADDQIIPLRESELMHQQIASSRLVVIPGAGHLLNMEQPEKYNQTVREFLNFIA